jgi:hypothetical protein
MDVMIAGYEGGYDDINSFEIKNMVRGQYAKELRTYFGYHFDDDDGRYNSSYRALVLTFEE